MAKSAHARCFFVVTTALSIAAMADPAQAELRSSAPMVAVGFTSKLNEDLVLPTIAWRWQLGAGERLTHWAQRIGTDLSFVIEPAVAGIFGDKDSVEAQIVPFVRLEPESMRSGAWSPYFEGGIGVIYTALEGLRLGSNVLFSDNLGAGLSFAVPALGPWTRVSLGYRYRHISHAGIFGEPNSGMNTHYLTIALQ